jgi:hypothetical protein
MVVFPSVAFRHFHFCCCHWDRRRTKRGKRLEREWNV